MKVNTRTERGFTLIELLVVIAIIAVLAGIIFPVYKGVTGNAHRARCMSQLHQIGLAVKLYAQDQKQYPPSVRAVADAGYLDVTRSASGVVTNLGEKVICADDPNRGSVSGSSVATFRGIYYLQPQNFSSYWITKNSNIDYSEDFSSTLFTSYNSVWNYNGYTSATNPTEFEYTAGNETTYQSLMGDLDGDGTTGDTDDVGLYPRLRNRFAPSNTIVTYCLHHYSTRGRRQFIVLRVDSSAKEVNIRGTGTAYTSGLYNWLLQQ